MTFYNFQVTQIIDLVASENGVFLPPVLTLRNRFELGKPVLHYTLGYSSVCVGSVQLYSGHRGVHICTTSLS